VELILAKIDQAGALPQLRADRAIAEEFLTIPWLLVELAGRGFTVDSTAIAARRPWEGEKKLRNLPWKAQEDARLLGEQVRTELFVTGSVVSPRDAQVREVEARRRPRLAEARQEMLRRAVVLCASQLQMAVAEQSAAAGVISLMSIRTLLRIVHHDLDMPDIAGITEPMRQSMASATREHLGEMLAATGRAARVLAERQVWAAAYELLRVSEDAGLLLRLQISDPQETLRPFYDGLITAAIVYGWGEFHQRQDRVRAAGRYVQSPYANLDALVEASSQHQLGGLMFPTVVHYQGAQPLTIAVSNLPDRPVLDGGIGYSIKKDHPSELFARSGILSIGPGDLLEALIAATTADRLNVRRGLAETLEVVVRGFADTLEAVIKARRQTGA
jgi:hypothetical protein